MRRAPASRGLFYGIVRRQCRPVHELPTIEEYRRLTGSGQSIVEQLAMPEGGEIEFEAPRVRGLARPADLRFYTNVVSELRKARSGRVVAWADSVPSNSF